MSSPGFPTLNLDVRARRAEPAIATIAIALAASSTVLLQLPGIGILIFGTCIGLVVATGFWASGWLGGRHRLTRVVSQSDGRWLLCRGDGREIEAILHGDSRVTPYVIWLRWNGFTGRSLLLCPGDLPAPDLRRLAVRLRLQSPPSLDRAHES